MGVWGKLINLTSNRCTLVPQIDGVLVGLPHYSIGCLDSCNKASFIPLRQVGAGVGLGLHKRVSSWMVLTRVEVDHKQGQIMWWSSMGVSLNYQFE